MLADLALGFSVALSATNLVLCLLGCLIGTLIGVLPGIGPIATISILLPFTFGISPVGSMIMLAGIYYGAQYGGSTTAILVRMPGEASSIVTMLDGHAMARNGRAGAALAIAALGSFVAGCVATLVIGAFARAARPVRAPARARGLLRADRAGPRALRSCWPAARCSMPSCRSCSA